MLTLGIHDGHTATACLFEDGEIIACISEERLNRVKEWSGFPEGAIKKCLEISGKSCEEIDAVGVCSLMPQIGTDGYFSPPAYKRITSHLIRVLPRSFLQSSNSVRLAQTIGNFLFRARRRNTIDDLSRIGFTTKNVFFFEHHLLHAAVAHHTNWYRNEKTLVITLDGSGDGVCATVNLGTDGNLERIAEVSNYNSICEFYTKITQFLGMKPMSHEYKVMGLAPYASGNGKSDVLSIMKGYFTLTDKDPLVFHNTSGLWKWRYVKAFEKRLVGKRFDWIAAAVQDVFEEVVLQWIRNAVRITGVGDLALSGGGFMNVKLNYLISKLPEVRSLFIFPSCGDESNAIGACILAALRMGFATEELKPLGMIFWGPSYSPAEVKHAIDKKCTGQGLKVESYEDVNEFLARRIVEGRIVGRFTGRMEWGARALGNRSILADPRNQKIIHKINKAIKMRDFWMPFAPAILKEFRHRYLQLREDYKCPFMTIAPDTNPEAWEEIPACLHPFDKSTRAQILDPENHGSFYELITRFAEITGVGGVLNTSFNLHGDPIVCSPDDAIDTFLKSDLDILQLEDFVIEK